MQGPSLSPSFETSGDCNIYTMAGNIHNQMRAMLWCTSYRTATMPYTTSYTRSCQRATLSNNPMKADAVRQQRVSSNAVQPQSHIARKSGKTQSPGNDTEARRQTDRKNMVKLTLRQRLERQEDNCRTIPLLLI